MIITHTVDIEVKPRATAQNPYAWDVPEEDGVFRPENHNGQPVIKKIIEYLYFTSGVSGGILCFVLLYVVLTQSKGPLKHYSRMLLLCCSSDIGFWFCDYTVQVRSKLTEGVFILTFEGPAKYLPYDFQIHAMCWYVCHLTLMHTIIPAQYFYRYYSVSRSMPMSKKQTMGLYIVSMVATIPMYYICYQAYRYSGSVKPGVNYAKYFYDEQPIPPLIVGDVDDIQMKLYFIASIIVVGGCYVLTLFLALITLKKLDINNSKYTTKTKEMQHQLTLVLLFQTILPVFTSVAPILAICVPCFLYISTGPSAGIFLAIVSWVPVLNPLLTIIVIAPYRRFVVNIFNRTKVNITSNNSDSQTNLYIKGVSLPAGINSR
ncbi:unnamed protein product [Bursaphelenchus okinawaensis]|uniref:G_PROTEIN_RECEP_F1_2 domain-containing protein n=1 Tax=Bursaphelenchus okinawaensis TaxID=465554 RepID=A0A811JRB7_9BILA|nr:unnamed protein product [Bursaphelenchus okinawaensis]CAG9079976.1 unnamed protein product [Bursaphelenchus okinawaensis]